MLHAAFALAVFATYWRLAPAQLYNVTDEGLRSGAGRTLVFLNFPVTLAAVAFAAVAADVIRSRRGDAVALAAAALCAVVAVPGVVDQDDLDARRVNVVPALGVALALGLTAAAAPRMRRGWSPRRTGDRLRLLIAVVLLLVSVPWIAAELGFHFGAGVFLSGELRTQPGVSGRHPAVHLGAHHGTAGMLLALTALLLSRVVPFMQRPLLRAATAFYVALMFVYGIVNVGQDFWLEQVVKRGWTSWEVPVALHPGLTWIWLGMVVAGAALWLALRP